MNSMDILGIIIALLGELFPIVIIYFILKTVLKNKTKLNEVSKENINLNDSLLKDILMQLEVIGYKALNKSEMDNSSYTAIYNGDNYYIKILPYYDTLTKELVDNLKKIMDEIHYHQGLIILGEFKNGFDGAIEYAEEIGIHIMDLETLYAAANGKNNIEDKEVISNLDEAEDIATYIEDEDENPIKSIEEAQLDKLKGPDKL